MSENGVDGPQGGPRTGKSAQRSRGAGERAYRRAVQGFSLVFVAVGLVVLAVTLVDGGGPVSVGVLIGVAFVGVGVGRLWVGSRMGQ